MCLPAGRAVEHLVQTQRFASLLLLSVPYVDLQVCMCCGHAFPMCACLDGCVAAENEDIGGASHALRRSVAVALAPNRVSTEMCLCVASLSLAMVMAGSGDVGTLRILRSIRRRCDRGVSYGA